MSIEIFPVFENGEEPPHAEWKWLDDCINDLDETVEQMRLTPLSRFVTYSREDALGAMSEDEVREMEEEAEFKDGWFHISGGTLWSLEPEWFDPREALRTTNALLEHLQAHPEQDGFPVKGYIYILKELQSALIHAQNTNQRFHLTPLC